MLLGVLVFLAAAILPSNRAAARAAGEASISGRVVDCRGLPRVEPPREVVLTSQKPSQQVRSVSVSSNGRFRVSRVRSGSYWISVPGGLVRAVRLKRGRDRRLRLLGCLPSLGGRYRPATAGEVRFLRQEAKAGRVAPLAARYRVIGGFGGSARHLRFDWAQRGAGPRFEYPGGPGGFRFSERTRLGRLLLVQHHGDVHLCQERPRALSWGCRSEQQPVGIGDVITRLSFDQEAVFDRFSELGRRAWLWTGKVHGIASHCLRSIWRGSRVTWCLAEVDGVFDFASSSLESIEMTHLFAGRPARVLFSLPKDVGRGPGPRLVAQYSVPVLLPALPRARRAGQARS